MLNTEKNDPAIAREILIAAQRFFRKRKGIKAHFEHGQWWILLDNGAQYSVMDANVVGGYCFEEVTPPQI